MKRMNPSRYNQQYSKKKGRFNYVIAEPEISAPPTAKPDSGHETDIVPSIQRLQNNIPTVFHASVLQDM
jgi:hypothetical protein